MLQFLHVITCKDKYNDHTPINSEVIYIWRLIVEDCSFQTAFV